MVFCSKGGGGEVGDIFGEDFRCGLYMRVSLRGSFFLASWRIVAEDFRCEWGWRLLGQWRERMGMVVEVGGGGQQG